MMKNYVRHDCFNLAPFAGGSLITKVANYMKFDGGKYPHVKEVFKESMRENHSFARQMRPEVSIRLGGVSVKTDRIFMELAIEAILNKPKRYLTEVLFAFTNQFTGTWTYSLDTYINWDEGKPFKEAYCRIVTHLCPKMWLLLPWTLVGILFCFLRRHRESYSILLFLFYLGILPIFVIDWNHRYRLPVEPYLYLFATYGVASTFNTISSVWQGWNRTESLKQLAIVFFITVSVLALFKLSRDYTLEYHYAFKGPQRMSPIVAEFKESVDAGPERLKHIRLPNPDGPTKLNHIRISNVPEVTAWVEVKYGGGVVHTNDDQRSQWPLWLEYNGDVTDIFYRQRNRDVRDVEVTLCYIDESWDKIIVEQPEKKGRDRG
jgi:hypothetical protein